MTTFGNAFDNEYKSSSTQSGASKRAASQNQKEARQQKKAKARGDSVNRGNKHGGYSGGSGNGRNGGGRGGRNGGRNGGGGGGGGGPGAHFGTGPVLFIQVCCVIAAVGQLVVGIIHTANMLEALDERCDDYDSPVLGSQECVGEALFWSRRDANGDPYPVCAWTSSALSGSSLGGTDLTDLDLSDLTTTSASISGEATVCTEDNQDYSSYMNAHWRQGVFSLVPDVFVDNWTPLIFGILAVCQCLSGVSSNW
eukprot:CAMPEP_0202711522 /NCGR_PEP_ID=MMETSP1385-20130828/23311_1 /ASSEMBLY_ACC=CAM_ASM_000861 /TAXON_ID=933848 /ORGANISM="Elphidium margaritaceum" /LENGTH=252 /DNA_ID=CAMNT_0049371273 /DNA_START=54 /DNA_END=809 /DNA_ORIENTATION=+